MDRQEFEFTTQIDEDGIVLSSESVGAGPSYIAILKAACGHFCQSGESFERCCECRGASNACVICMSGRGPAATAPAS